jgi:NAD(P)-dependent dehydrogenase (short-subunit alcohol dehydrogenase family)
MKPDADTVGMRPRTVLVTGATAGIGFETALAWAGRDTQLIITGRDPRRGRHAAEAISAEVGRPVTFLSADHGTVGGNQDLADRVAATVTRLDVLVKGLLRSPLRGAEAGLIGEACCSVAPLVSASLGLRRLPVPGRGDRGGGALVPALRLVLPRR